MSNWQPLGEIQDFQEVFEELPPQIDNSERRENERRPFVARMFFHNNEDLYEGLCRDISTGGMQVLMGDSPLEIGTAISINVHPENTEYNFVASGKVVRMLQGGQGFSFRFIDLSEEAKSAIEKYIKSE